MDPSKNLMKGKIDWLALSDRLLQEAKNQNNLPLERLKLLAIISSGLDEYFMVHVASIKRQAKVNLKDQGSKSELTAMQRLTYIHKKTLDIVTTQYHIYTKELLPLLQQEGIVINEIKKLTINQHHYLENYFDKQIYPVLTPLAIDAYRPFPKLMNKNLNLAITIDNSKLAIVQIPVVLKRYVEVPGFAQSNVFILVEDLISFYIHKLFTGCYITDVTAFRITRKTDLTINNSKHLSFLIKVDKELKKRKWGEETRLEIGASCYHNTLLYLQNRLQLFRKETYFIPGPLDLTFLFPFYDFIKKSISS